MTSFLAVYQMEYTSVYRLPLVMFRHVKTQRERETEGERERGRDVTSCGGRERERGRKRKSEKAPVI
jgi:hypothetical protein